MRSFEQRKDPGRLMLRRLVMLVLAIVLLLVLRGVWGVYMKERESRILRDQANVQLSDLRDREAKLRADIETLQTERGQETTLRENYKMAKEGEGLIVIVDQEEPEPPRQPTFLQRLKFWAGW